MESMIDKAKAAKAQLELLKASSAFRRCGVSTGIDDNGNIYLGVATGHASETKTHSLTHVQAAAIVEGLQKILAPSQEEI